MKFFPFLLLTMITLTVFGQSKYEEKYFTGLFVKNLDSSLNWYSEKLDFKVIDTVSNPKSGYKFALLSWNQILIEMIEHPKIITAKQIKENYPESTGTQGFFKLGFYVKELDSLQEKLKSKNVKILFPVLKAEGFTRKLKLFIIEDCEGNLIQFYNYL